MCGLIWVGGAASNKLAVPALTRMDYRGYDSFGFACLTSAGIEVERSLDSLRGFNQALPLSEMVLGHTRWATHGSVSLHNCHPHFDPKGRFAIAHNGIVSNAQSIADGASIEWSQQNDESDTLVLVRLLSQCLDRGMCPASAFQFVAARAKGRNTLVCMFDTGEVLAYRFGSPLVLIRFDDHQFALASDALAFTSAVKDCYPVEQGECLVIKGDTVTRYLSATHANGLLADTESEAQLNNPWLEVTGGIQWEIISHDYLIDDADIISSEPVAGEWMRAEVLEQWRTIPLQAKTSEESESLLKLVSSRSTLLMTGAGGAGIVADQLARLIQAQTRHRAIACSACEIERFNGFANDACLLAISQSGETADTIHAIEQAKLFGMPVISLVNMPLSSMARLSDLTVELGVGPEQCVLSTKSATAQIAFGYWLAGQMAGHADTAVRSLQQLGVTLSQQLDIALFDQYLPAVDYLEHSTSVFLLGRGLHYATACLGALNLKEASYIHAEAFSAGELKHGVIALIESGVPVILFGLESDPYMLGVASELRSRGATILAVGSDQGDISIPDIANGHPAGEPIGCQILSYLLAKRRGINPDRPRNLAKSVTVL